LGYNPAAHWGAHTLGDLFKRERQRETERNREAEREREREREMDIAPMWKCATLLLSRR